MNSKSAHVPYESGSEGALQQHFNIETAANLLVPWAPVEEQRDIGAKLGRRVESVRDAERKIGLQIEKLREYRQTLISAAVTGRIEVSAVETTSGEGR